MSSMLQFHHAGTAPSLDEVRRQFDLSPGELDAAFGVLATDPAAGLFTVLVADAAVARVQQALARRPAHTAEGLFGNPRVEPT